MTKRIEAEIPDELYTRLRSECLVRFGGKKGCLQQAITEALELWLRPPKAKLPEMRGTVEKDA